jgi:ABC-type bacteriocin/lantibiotic exporter with double-glycine peptidase domain
MMRIGESSEFWWLLSKVRPFLRLHMSSYVCIVLASVFTLIDPLIVRLLIDDIIPNRRIGLLPLLALAFLFTYIGRLGCDSLAGMLNFRAVQKMTFRTRLSLLLHLQRLSAEYHDNRPLGDTLHRIQVDVDQIGTLSGEVIPTLLRILTLFTLVMTTMLLLNYRLTMIVLPLIPVFILVRRQFRNRLQQASDLVQAQSGKMIGFLEEHLSAMVQVQLLACEQREARRFARISGDAVRAQMKRCGTELFFSSLLYLIVVLGMASVLCYGGYQVMNGTLTAGGLVASYGYTLQLFIPLYGVVDIYAKIQRAAASARRLMEIEKADLVLHDRLGALALQPNAPGAIELKEVSFSYNVNRPVLDNLSLRVEAGERVAIAGTSGNGKSTIAKLIARLYDARAGTVLLEGRDVRDIKLRSLRSSVIFVPQDAVLFDLTLRENLLYGNPRATSEELESVINLAQLDSVVARLPEGLDQPLGPRGNRLSGGERQRVALARALLQHPKVLILDECTSALDELTEKRLFNGLHHYLKGITTIIISHRPYPTHWAHRVIQLNYGHLLDESQLNISCQ